RRAPSQRARASAWHALRQRPRSNRGGVSASSGPGHGAGTPSIGPVGQTSNPPPPRWSRPSNTTEPSGSTDSAGGSAGRGATSRRTPRRPGRRFLRPGPGADAGSPAFPGVRARDATGGQCSPETLEVLDREVERGSLDRPDLDRLAEIEPDATGRQTAECDVSVPEAATDADRGDPLPRTL